MLLIKIKTVLTQNQFQHRLFSSTHKITRTTLLIFEDIHRTG